MWSSAVLKPLFKGGEKCDKSSSSYRPVSLLSAMGRLLEGLLSAQMNDFAEETNFIHPNVHGYRKGMSTSTALMEVQTRLLTSMEKGKVSSLCLVDVSAGFDTVSNIFLLRKLELYGYDDSTLEWIDSYLSNRVQKVQVSSKE